MATRLIFGLLVMLVSAHSMAQAYRWVDENGVVHYSDRPEPGAQEIVLPTPNTVQTRRPAARDSATRSDASGDDSESATSEPFTYTSLEITSPEAEETLWNIEGVLNVSLDLQPGLQPGHQVRVYFDGEPRMVSGTSFQVQEVWRGVHNLQAEVLDETGKMLIRSRTNRFYVQQNTIIR